MLGIQSIMTVLMLLGQLFPSPGPGRAPFGGGGGGTEWVTGQSVSATANNQTICVGTKFNVSSGVSFSVTELGRWVVSGNSASHILTLTDTSGTSLGACSVNTSGQTPGTYVYCVLGTPIAITGPVTGYAMFSQELSGGDHWGNPGASITTTAVAANQGGASGTISGNNCTSPTGWETSDKIYGPVNFKYQ
jgi:hypothetical protein